MPPGPANTDYEGLAYLGEYPLAWAACLGNETVYNKLLDYDADPNAQDNFGNMILHMVVVCNQLVSLGRGDVGCLSGMCVCWSEEGRWRDLESGNYTES